jgi:hypothetical protein
VRYTVLRRLHLSRLQLPTRILLTCFVLSIDAALVVGSIKYVHRAEFSPAGAQRYWRGDGAAREGLPPLLTGEEDIEDGAGARSADAPPKSARFLVDTAHPHLFSVPIVLFILLHLLVLTRLPDAAKVALDLHAFVSFAATFGLPFWIAAEGRGATLFVTAGANLLLNFAAVSAILLFETWRRVPAGSHLDGEMRRSTAIGR